LKITYSRIVLELKFLLPILRKTIIFLTVYFWSFFFIGLRHRWLRSLSRKVGTFGTVVNKYIFCKVFAHYEPEWSPIQELVAAAVTYSQSCCVTDSSQRAVPRLFKKIIQYRKWYSYLKKSKIKSILKVLYRTVMKVPNKTLNHTTQKKNLNSLIVTNILVDFQWILNHI